VNVDELERNLIRNAQRELAPSAADRERHEAELFARLGGGSAGSAPLGGGSAGPAPLGGGSAGPLGGGVASRRAGGAWGSGRSSDALAQAVLARAAQSPAGWSRVGLSQVALVVRSSRFGMLGLGMVLGAMIGGWFGFGLGRSAWSAPGESAREWGAALPATAGAKVDPAAIVAGEASALDSSSAAGELRGSEPRVTSSASSEALLSPGASSLSATAAEPARGVGSGRARGVARRAPAAGEGSSLAAEVAMLQRARRALNAQNGRLALGIVHDLDEQFPNGVLLEERSATRILSLCQLQQVDEARGAAQAFLERYPASVYAERVRGSCGVDRGE
jgi:hypothetical protein